MSKNIVKVRDDHEPIKFEVVSGKVNTFKFCEGLNVSWAKEEFTAKDLRDRIFNLNIFPC